ncbi:MAG: M12 family metallo-peptidase [Syntrophobacterales bacterium]|nr:M12 family metallo-peptidase [Syntrophobacterales bacterium]
MKKMLTFIIFTILFASPTISMGKRIVLSPIYNDSLSAHKVGGSSFLYVPQRAVLSQEVLSSLLEGDLATIIVGGERIEVTTTGIKKRPGGLTWSAKPEGLCSWDTIVITLSDNVAFGTIFRGDRRLKIKPTSASGILLVEEENPAFEMPLGEDTIPQPKPPEELLSDFFTYENLSGSSNTIVDLMAYYTPGVENYLGGASNVRAGIQHLVDLTNEAYRNSKIDLEIRLVHIQKVSYPDSGSIHSALDDLTNGRSVFSEVSSLRDRYGADLVTLLRRFDRVTNGGCGLAWILTSLSNPLRSSGYGFSVVQVGKSMDGSNYYCLDLTLAHELGHNFGCAHDRDHASNPGIFSYSYGYDRPGIFATIMSYDSPKIPYFSNPSITYQGYAIGVPEGYQDAADNSRTIRETKNFVASYRREVSPSCTVDDRIQKIYIAYYQRPGDPGGIEYWLGILNRSGGNLNGIINSFATSVESQNLYGQINSSTIGNVIDAIYLALFDRRPDSIGKAFYTNGFINGTFTPGTIALNILDGARGSDLDAINNKLTVANKFSCEVKKQGINYAGESDANRARQFLRTVTSDPTSVDTAFSRLQSLLEEIRN